MDSTKVDDKKSASVTRKRGEALIAALVTPGNEAVTSGKKSSMTVDKKKS